MATPDPTSRASPSRAREGGPRLALEPLPAPAGPGSRVPSLARDPRGGTWLSWVGPVDGGGHALRLARRADGAWGGVAEASAGEDWLVNWADVPGAAALADGTVVAHWLRRYPNPDYPYAYYAHLAVSPDGGETWGDPQRLHDDRSPAEHGFVTAFPLDAHRLGLVWLDGRSGADATEGAAAEADPGGRPAHGGATALYFRTVDGGGDLGPEVRLDPRVCDCCPTSVAWVAGVGPLVAYRDRGADERRDVALVQPSAGGWSEPRTVQPDGWRITACPVNGPALAASGRRVALVWYTEGELTERAGRPLVRAALSRDGGETFDALGPVDDGQPLGRVSAAVLDDGTLVAAWLERVSDGAEWRARAWDAHGTRGPSVTIAPTTRMRAAGLARVAATADGALVTWTDVDADRVAVARLSAER